MTVFSEEMPTAETVVAESAVSESETPMETETQPSNEESLTEQTEGSIPEVSLTVTSPESAVTDALETSVTDSTETDLTQDSQFFADTVSAFTSTGTANNISLTFDNGIFVNSWGEDVPSGEVSFFAYGISIDDYTYPIDIDRRVKCVRAYNSLFNHGAERVTAIGSARVNYAFTDSVPAEYADSVAVYTTQNGVWTPIYTNYPVIENGYIRSVSFDAVLPDFDMFCVVWTDPESVKPDESILSSDREYYYNDTALNVTATAFAGAVCTGGDFPENANKILFTVDKLNGTDNRYYEYEHLDCMTAKIYAPRFYSEDYEHVSVSDYNVKVEYTLTDPVPEGFGSAMKVYTADENGAVQAEYESVVTNGGITAISFTVGNGTFAVYEPQRTAADYPLSLNNEYFDIHANIPANSLVTAGDRTLKAEETQLSAHILIEDEISALPVIAGYDDHKIRYVEFGFASGTEKASVSDHTASIECFFAPDDNISSEGVVLMRLDGDRWTEFESSSIRSAEGVLQGVSFNDNGSTVFAVIGKEIEEPSEPHFYEYTDGNITVNVETDAQAVFTVEDEEISADEVRLYAREITDTAAQVSVEEDERIKLFDIGFETADGTAVTADLLTSQIDFSVKGEEGETISNIEVFALTEGSEAEKLDVTEESPAAGGMLLMNAPAPETSTEQTVSVEDDKLTVYAVKYTVDFHYGDFEYNLAGGGEMLLSELFTALEIDESTKGSEADFTNPDVLKTEKVTENIEGEEVVSDWRLISLQPFTTAETLSVRLANGGNIDIAVTDDQTLTRYLAKDSSYYFRDILDWIGIEGGHDDHILMMGQPSFQGVDSSAYEVVPIYTADNNIRDYLVTINSSVSGATLYVGESEFKVYKDSAGKYTENPDESDGSGEYTVKYNFVNPVQTVNNSNLHFDLRNGTDTKKGENNTDTWTPDTNEEGHYFEYELYYSVSGQDEIAPGDMNIILPLHILRDLNNNYADEIELSIPDEELYESTKHNALATDKIYFTYTVDTANNVVRIKNVKPLTSGDNPTIVFAYKTKNKTYDYPDCEPSEPCFANIRINTADSSGNSVVVSARTNEIPVQIDTDVVIKKTEKTISSSDIHQSWLSEWNRDLTIDAHDSHYDNDIGETVYDYIYMVWKVNSTFVSHDSSGSEIGKITQRYDFSLKNDDVSATVGGISVDGEIIGVYLSGDNKWTAWDGDEETTARTGLTDKTRTDYVLVKYKKEDVNKFTDDGKGISVTFKNDVENKIVPKGELDEDTDDAHGEIIYVPPVYTPPVDTTRLDKVGKFGGDKTVGSENDVSYYNLEKLKNNGQDITGLKYYVSAFASVLPETFEVTVNPMGTEDDVVHYQKSDVEFSLIDDGSVKPFVLTDLYKRNNDPNNAKYELTDNDYCFTQIDYELLIQRGEYDGNEKEFVSHSFSDDDEANIELWVRTANNDDYVKIGTYNAVSKEMMPEDGCGDYADSITESGVVFNRNDIVGYKFYSKNQWFTTSVKAWPYVTLKATDAVRSHIKDYVSENDSFTKIQLDNTAVFSVKKNDIPVDTKTATGRTFVSKENRDSLIRKTVNIPSDENEVMNHLYKVPWKIEMKETVTDANGGDPAYVYQQSGRFYDLLPVTSTAKIESIKVYAGNADGSYTELGEGEYTYNIDGRRYDGSHKMDRVLLTLDIEKGAYFYILEITTIHTYEDILDYGRNLINSAAYETGNDDIAKGYPDNGGTISEKTLMNNLDPDTDDYKFIYSQATWNVQALISNLIGLRKQVSSNRDVIPASKAIVGPDEIYTYTYRQKNGNTAQKNIVFMDAVENLNGDANYNTAFKLNREWRGEPVAFRFGNLGTLGVAPVLYVTEQDVDLEKYAPEKDENGDAADSTFAAGFISTIMLHENDANYSPKDGWHRLYGSTDSSGNTTWYTDAAMTKEYDLKKMKAFMLDLSKKEDGNDFILPANGTITFSLDMRSPARGMIDKEGYSCEDIYTYNNVYISYAYGSTAEEDSWKSSYMHQDYTTVTYRVIGDVRLRKTNSVTGEVISGVQFKLTGTSDYGEFIEKYMTTNSKGEITFSGIEKGTYTLTEENQTDDFLPVNPMTVVIDENGTATIQTPSNKMYVFDLYLNTKDQNGTVTYGVTYELYKGKDLTGTDFDESDPVDTQTQPYHADLGTYVFKDIPIGNYTLRESYGSVVKTYSITHENDGSVVWSNGTDIYSDTDGDIKRYYRITRKVYGVEDTPRIHGDLTFKKNDSLKNTGITGAEFTLTTTGNGDNDKTKYGTPVEMTAASSSGNVTFENIELGRYVLTETTYPDGYAPVYKTYYVEVTAAADNSAIIKMYTDDSYETEVTKPEESELYLVENEPFAGFTIRKVDSVNITEKLARAEFDLIYTPDSSIDGNKLDTSVWQKSDENYIQHVSTDIRGIAQFKDLKRNTSYTLVEVKAPEHHEEISESNQIRYTVNVNSSGEVTLTPVAGTNAARVLTENDEDIGLIYNITNKRTYDSNVTIVKKWIGDPYENGFPVLTLKTKEEVFEKNVVTIDSSIFKSSLSGITAIEFVDTGTESEDSFNTAKKDIPGESGTFKIKREGATLKIWTNADRIYIDDCTDLFKDSKITDTGIKPFLDRVNTSKVTSMKGMFWNCTELTTLDLTKFDTSRVTDMSYMFCGANKLQSIDVSTFDTSSVTDMSYMFAARSGDIDEGNDTSKPSSPNTSLISLNLMSFETSKVTTFKCMFLDNTALERVLLDSNRFTAGSNLEYVTGMFSNCNKLEGINLSGFSNCSNLKDTSYWFDKCWYLQYIDLSNFVTSTELKNIKGMFRYSGRGKYGGKGEKDFTIDADVGTAVFAFGKWTVSNDVAIGSDPSSWDNFYRIKLYGKIYKDAQGGTYPKSHVEHLQIKGLESNGNAYGNPSKVDTQVRCTVGYFNNTTDKPTDSKYSAYSSYYEWMKAQYPLHYQSYTPPIVTPSSSTDNSVTSISVDIDPLDIGTSIVTYTTKSGTGFSGSDTETVGETATIVDSYGTETPENLQATWTKVSDSQWICEVKVYNPNSVYEVKEDEISGYESEAYNGLTMSSSSLTITNKQDEVPDPTYGHLKIEKHIIGLYGDHVEKAKLDCFTFNIVLEKPDGSEFSNNEYFSFTRHWIDESTREATEFNGSRLFTVDESDNTKLVGKAYLVENGWIEFTDIPESWKYTVTEVEQNGNQVDEYTDPDNPAEIIGYTSRGAYTSGATTDTGSYSTSAGTGTIVEYTETVEGDPTTGNAAYVLWGNSVDRKSLIVTKNAVHTVDGDKTEEGKDPETVPLTDSEKETEFIYNIHLSNLLIYGSTRETEHDGQGYPYPIKIFDSTTAATTWADLENHARATGALETYGVLGENDIARYQNTGTFFRAKPDGTADIKVALKPGQTFRIYNLPRGAQYTVSEESNGDWELESIDIQAVQADDTDYAAVPSSFNDGKGTQTGSSWNGTITDDNAVPHLTFKNVLDTPKTVEISTEKKWTKTDTDHTEKDITELTEAMSYADMLPVSVSLIREYTDTTTHQTTIDTAELNRDSWTAVFADLPEKRDGGGYYNYYITEPESTLTETYYKTSATFGETPQTITVVYRNGANTITIGGTTYTYSDSGSATVYVDKDDQTIATTVNGKVLKDGETVKYVEYPINSRRFVEANEDGTALFTLYETRYNTANATQYAIFAGDAQGNMNVVVTNRLKDTYTVSLKKEVDGNLGDKSHSYKFTVTLTDKNGNAWTSGGIMKVDIDGEIQDYPFILGVQDIYLTHGQTAKILGIPENEVKVSITEASEPTYTTQSSLALGTDFETENLSNTNTQSTAAVINSDVYVYYKNKLNVTVPTGVGMKTAPLAAVTIVIMSGIMLLYRRQKVSLSPDEKEDEGDS